jgi:uncharacterized protein YbaR (Trm112 family)
LDTGADTYPWPLLCCPRCAGSLAPPPSLACTSCGKGYPLVDGVPWLLPEPDAALGEWRVRVRAFTAELETQAAKYRAALAGGVSRSATRNRLKLLAAACSDHARRLRALLAPLGAEPSGAAVETYRALHAAPRAGQGLAAYYTNLHRDWCWGEAENEVALRAVSAALGEEGPGRTLVLGSGAGRLAYDLRVRRGAQPLVAADVNPLMTLVARRVLAGECVELYEFPVAPRDLQSHALLRRLHAPAPAPEGLYPVLADVSQGPFAAEAFDTVVTPWLIDIVDEDFATIAAHVNRWLRPGGRWVNSGSLFFEHAEAARCYSTEEVREIVEAGGFEFTHFVEETTPYLCSPASRHGRLETVVTFSAVRTAASAAPPRHEPVQAWLRSDDTPVPLLPEFGSRALAMRIHAYVASLVDGRRTLREIADVLVRERLMTADEAGPAVRSFLQRLYDEAQLPWRP